MMVQDAKLKKAIYDALYYQNNKAKKLQYCADLYKEKSEEIKQRTKLDYSTNKEARATKKAQWKKSNKNKIAFYSAKRRASERNATPAWADLNKIQDFYDTANGLSMLTGIWYHVDHIIPLTNKYVCGLHTQSNLQVIPAKDNLIKKNKFLEFV